VILWLTGHIFQAQTALSSSTAQAKPDNAFLFQNGELTDSDSLSADDMLNWDDMRSWLEFRFKGLPETLPEGPDGMAASFTSVDPNAPATLEITPLNSATRVLLTDGALSDPSTRHEALRHDDILAHQTAALNRAPYAICKTDAAGNFLWQNPACHAIQDEIEGDMKTLIGKFPEPGESQTTRVSIPRKDQSDPSWYEVHSTESHGSFMHYAVDITRVVEAEAAQRQFVQTLTKTFANLTTGLAMFDRKQQLVLFNPALIDLTALPAEFLSARPSLISFFDNLRDRQVMPEPKNYADWREQITHVIETASDGLYLETWTLPTGVTYRVTGRPHPDGAVAFLFEDITAEISLTRRFRAQLDVRQSVLDALDEAVVVIAPNNVVMFCNQASTKMLGVDPDTSFADMSTRDLIAACNTAFPDSDFWQDIRSHIINKSLDPAPTGIVTNPGGGKMTCRVLPLVGGAAMLCITAQSVHIPAEESLLPM
jgi:PAS domain-containing protein